MLGAVITAPLLAPGFVLSYDMAFVPRPRLSMALLGVSSTPPRSVPSALILALLSRALTGAVVEKAVLFGLVALAGIGAARLVPSDRTAARVGAGILYAWNPYVYERLLLGHWALLLGTAVLPWVVAAAVRLRQGRPNAVWGLVVAMFAAMLPSPYGGMLATLVCLFVALAPPWERSAREALRRAGLVTAVAIVTNLPWLVPSALGPSIPQRGSLAAAVFRARSDSPLGTVGSLLSLGGLWRTDLAPPGRNTLVWVPLFVVIAALCVAGWRILGTRWPPGAAVGLLGAAALGLLLAAAPGIPGLAAGSRFLARLPGGGVLRDSQKFVVPLALAASVGFGLGVERVVDVVGGRGRPLVAASAMALLPIGMAPTLAWGATGRLFTATYPASWDRVEAIVSSKAGGGGVLVLPWHAYLPFGWNRNRVVHQPALQYFSRPVLSSSALEVGSIRLPEEDPWGRRAAPLVVGGSRSLAGELEGLGVRYVLLFKEADWASYPPRLIGLAPVLETADLRLYESRAPTRVPAFPTPPLAPVVAGDVLAAGLVAAAAVAGARSGRRSGSRGPPAS